MLSLAGDVGLEPNVLAPQTFSVLNESLMEAEGRLNSTSLHLPSAETLPHLVADFLAEFFPPRRPLFLVDIEAVEDVEFF